MMASGGPQIDIPTLALPQITNYMVDGYGGSYYDLQFPVPVYNGQTEGVYNTTSWSDIDQFYNYAVSNSMESAVSFGVCVVTLLNIIVLTPQSKRRLPLHSFICLALVLQIVRNAIDMVLMTRSVPSSSYAYLTRDLDSIKLSDKYYALIATAQISACLSFVFVQACFFIQGRALMTWLQLHYRIVYYSILALLVLGGIIALAFRISLAVLQIFHPFRSGTYTGFRVSMHGTLITYGISIGSWSLIFFASTVSIILNRRRTLFSGNTLYDIALNVVAVIGLQSFIVPIIFCVMQLIPGGLLSKPEHLIIPSVLFLLPIGSLFLAVHSQENPTHDNGKSVTHSHPHALPSESNQQPVATARPSPSPPSMTATDPVSKSKYVDPIEIELASIDAIGELQGTPVTHAYASDGQAEECRLRAHNALFVPLRSRASSQLIP